MTQSLSTIDTDRPPAMYRIEAVAIVVSRISMNVGTTTATATNQGLTAGRLTAAWVSATLLILRPPRRTNVPRQEFVCSLRLPVAGRRKTRPVPGCLALVPGFGA